MIILAFIGGLVVSVIGGIVGSIFFMFLMFNLAYLILKCRPLSSIFGKPKQSSARISNANYAQCDVNYYETVVNPFLRYAFNIKARKHTSCIVQKGEHHHKDSDKKSNPESGNSLIPEVMDNPITNPVHSRTVAQEDNSVQPKKNDTNVGPF